MAQRNIRLIQRNDSSENWKANENVILARGEMGLEFLDDGTVKAKFGDGVTSWKMLKYFCDIEEGSSVSTSNFLTDDVLILDCGGAAEHIANES